MASRRRRSRGSPSALTNLRATYAPPPTTPLSPPLTAPTTGSPSALTPTGSASRSKRKCDGLPPPPPPPPPLTPHPSSSAGTDDRLCRAARRRGVLLGGGADGAAPRADQTRRVVRNEPARRAGRRDLARHLPVADARDANEGRGGLTCYAAIYLSTPPATLPPPHTSIHPLRSPPTDSAGGSRSLRRPNCRQKSSKSNPGQPAT